MKSLLAPHNPMTSTDWAALAAVAGDAGWAVRCVNEVDIEGVRHVRVELDDRSPGTQAEWVSMVTAHRPQPVEPSARERLDALPDEKLARLVDLLEDDTKAAALVDVVEKEATQPRSVSR